MTEYRFATAADWPKVIDFIDLVFSQVSKPHDFAKLIPKVYGDGHDFSHLHAIALEDGEIRGCVAVLPFEMTVAGQTLRVGYLGSVSVHRLSRGAGHMKKLMQMQLDRARADGLDMLALGGQRQRYGYFGFSPAGGVYQYGITTPNVRHALKELDISAISFDPLAPGESSAYACALYQQQPVCGARTPERFAEIARSFEAQGWLVKNSTANAGYLIASEDCRTISELVMEDSSLVPAVLKAWKTLHAVPSLQVSAAPHNKALNRTLAAFAEGYTLRQDGYLHCLNYANTIRCWMALKNSVTPLSEGALRLGIGDETICISVSGGDVCVENSEAASDIRLSPAEADQLLFGFNRFYAPEPTCTIPADWFPLPLCIPSADTF